MKRKRNVLGNPVTTYYYPQSAESWIFGSSCKKKTATERGQRSCSATEAPFRPWREASNTRGGHGPSVNTHTVVFIKSRFGIVIDMRFAHLSSFPWLESSVSRMMDKEVKAEREREECGLKFGCRWLWETLFSGSARHAAIRVHACTLSSALTHFNRVIINN